jgi:hypothetical protein
MSAKTQFLQKLQTLHASPATYDHKSQADIAAFRQRISLLQETITQWLTETGIDIESTAVSLTDLLVGDRAFEVPGLVLRYENRLIKFTPLFLYGQGVTGCVEVSLFAEGQLTPLYRLFMRAGDKTEWSGRPLEKYFGDMTLFTEETFFGMIQGLLP